MFWLLIFILLDVDHQRSAVTEVVYVADKSACEAKGTEILDAFKKDPPPMLAMIEAQCEGPYSDPMTENGA